MLPLDAPAIITVHGFNTKDEGLATTDKIATALYNESIAVQLDYGFTFLEGVRIRNVGTAKKLQSSIDFYHRIGRKVIVIGHSNGCAIAHIGTLGRAPERQADMYIYVNPALRNNLAPGAGVKKLVVYYSPHDGATQLAQIGHPLSVLIENFLPEAYKDSRPWGDMGMIGYTGDDPRVSNINEEVLYKASQHVYKTIGHSEVFTPEVFPIFLASLRETIAAALPNL